MRYIKVKTDYVMLCLFNSSTLTNHNVIVISDKSDNEDATSHVSSREIIIKHTDKVESYLLCVLIHNNHTVFSLP